MYGAVFFLVATLLAPFVLSASLLLSLAAPFVIPWYFYRALWRNYHSMRAPAERRPERTRPHLYQPGPEQAREIGGFSPCRRCGGSLLAPQHLVRPGLTGPSAEAS